MWKAQGAVLNLLIFVTAGCSNHGPASAGEVSLDARRVMEKTKTTTSSYSVYFWNKITQPGQSPVEEGSAEFHSGNLHRVETPRDRIVADCRRMSGSYFSVTSGEIIEGPKVAGAACGINANIAIISMELIGDVETKFGKAQRVRVTDAKNVREYDVSQDGVLLKSTYRENRPGGALLIVTEAIKFERHKPDKAMFDKASLSKRYLPVSLQK
jgi:hypothetical protein